MFLLFNVSTGDSRILLPFKVTMAGLKALALTLSLLRQIHCLEFDFIIIGGGTAGLTVANRLSQHSHISVAVIEAGAEENHNPNVTSADGFLSALGTHVDWQYKSTNQTYAAGQAIDYHSGKALGGTSTINGLFSALWKTKLTKIRNDLRSRREVSD